MTSVITGLCYYDPYVLKCKIQKRLVLLTFVAIYFMTAEPSHMHCVQAKNGT